MFSMELIQALLLATIIIQCDTSKSILTNLNELTTEENSHHLARNYVYLNYKEVYGLRYDPKNFRKKVSENIVPIDDDKTNQIQNEERKSDRSTTTTTIGDAIEMISISPLSFTVDVTNEIPSSAPPSPPSFDGGNDDYNGSNESANDQKDQDILLDTTLNSANIDDENTVPSKSANNTEQFIEEDSTTAATLPSTSTSSLRNILSLVRNRLKQWFTFGNTSVNNEQRFLNVFNVIQFDNSICMSTKSGFSDISGICYPDYQCSQMGGLVIDYCADGMGACCIFQTDCGKTTKYMTSYFQNPGWPGASQERLICTLTVEIQPGVEQIQLDFVSFELKAPEDGNCVDDQFFVAGQNLNNQIPTICGINNGQHMFVEVSNAVDRKIFLSVLTTGPSARAFNIRINQLKTPIAPYNCLQYYNDPEGWIQTFNYEDESKFVSVRNPSYFNDMNYVICIKRQWNFCSITYSNEVYGTEYIFQLLNLDADGLSIIPEKQAGVEIFSCSEDYIAVNSIRLCGEKLNDASRSDDLSHNDIVVDTSNGLNIIPVRTNENTVGRGFRINYRQNPCQEQTDQQDAEVFDEIIQEDDESDGEASTNTQNNQQNSNSNSNNNKHRIQSKQKPMWRWGSIGK